MIINKMIRARKVPHWKAPIYVVTMPEGCNGQQAHWAKELGKLRGVCFVVLPHGSQVHQ